MGKDKKELKKLKKLLKRQSPSQPAFLTMFESVRIASSFVASALAAKMLDQSKGKTLVAQFTELQGAIHDSIMSGAFGVNWTRPTTLAREHSDLRLVAETYERQRFNPVFGFGFD